MHVFRFIEDVLLGSDILFKFDERLKIRQNNLLNLHQK